MESRPSSASIELADDAAFTQIERARHNSFVESLTDALKRLQETKSPPKRQTSWEMFIHGYFEFQSRSAKSSCTPTPGWTPKDEDSQNSPATSLTIDTPTTPLDKEYEEIWNKKLTELPKMKGRKRMRSEEPIADIVLQRRITRSNSADSDSLWQLDVTDGRPRAAYKRRKVV